MAGIGGDQRRGPEGRREDANLRAILDATADGVVVVDRDGVVCFANPAAEELFGRRAEELIGDVFGFPVVAGATAELDVVRRPGEDRVVEMRVVKSGGRAAPRAWPHCATSRIASGRRPSAPSGSARTRRGWKRRPPSARATSSWPPRPTS
jgi:PAS domain S-box-containing protein